MKKAKRGPLQELLALPLKERLNAIAKDVRARRKKFNKIPAHDLAEALGVPRPDQPGPDWAFTHYAERRSVEEEAECNVPSEIIGELQGKISPERFKVLLQKAERLDGIRKPQFKFLTKKERHLLEEAIAEEDLEANEYNGMNCIAHHSVKIARGRFLMFEAVVEDDGTCINLKTPYDEAVGGFVDLRKCVTEDLVG